MSVISHVAVWRQEKANDKQKGRQVDFLKLRTLCLKRFVSPLRLAWGSLLLLWPDSEVLCMIIQLHFVQLFLFYLNLLFFVVSMMCTLGKPYKTKTRVNLGIAHTAIGPPFCVCVCVFFYGRGGGHKNKNLPIKQRFLDRGDGRRDSRRENDTLKRQLWWDKIIALERKISGNPKSINSW